MEHANLTETRTERFNSNIVIPDGLLQNASSNFYAYSRRHADVDDTQDLADVLELPAQAVLATHPLHRSRTPDVGPGGRAQIGLGRAFSARSRRISARSGADHARPEITQHLSSSPQVDRPRKRARTIGTDYAQPQHAGDAQRPGSPYLLELVRTPSLRYTASSLGRATTRSPTFEDLDVSGQPTISRTPTHRFGRISIVAPEDIPRRQLRHASFVPVEDPVGVRRTTSQNPATRQSMLRKASVAVKDAFSAPIPKERQSSIRNTYERAISRKKQLQRSKPFQILFRYAVYLLLLAFVYFVLVGRPLWGGTVWYIYILFEYHLTFVGGSAIFIGLAFFYAFGPLLVLFEKSPPPAPEESHAQVKEPKEFHFPPAPFVRCFDRPAPLPTIESTEAPVVVPPLNQDTALLIPCYKSATLLPATLTAALKVFPATSIFILANGNSPTPLDDTEEVCNDYGVHHIYVPIGSKIVAQYVGAYLARTSHFPFALLIDDDCLLPPNFPVVSDRLNGTGRVKIRCLGYTITSIGPGRSKGTWAQQAQDLEYKLSGLQRLFAGKIGSATFPHGAIVLWDTEFLVQTFKEHPGFSVSEDWFFGHVARELGSRITMCSSVFVETETPASVFWSGGGGARGGFGEMTIFKQRFKRWNFFFVNGCYYNLKYILFSWRLELWEIGAKFFVFQEVYETALYLITPLVLPISLIVRPAYTAYLFAGTLGLYALNAMIFNEVHLRLSGRMVNRWMLLFYYMPFKLALTFVNVASCWWSLWQYAKYFAQRHPKIIEDERAVGVVLKIEEDSLNEKQEVEELAVIGEEGEVGVFSRDFALQRTGATRQARSGLRSGSPLDRAPTPTSAVTKVSTESAIDPLTIPRRLTVTAVKVDVVTDPTSAEELQSDIANRHGVGSDQVFMQNIDASDFTSLRRQSTADGARDQFNRWAPSWLGGAQRSGHRESNAMEDVAETADEYNEKDDSFDVDRAEGT